MNRSLSIGYIYRCVPRTNPDSNTRAKEVPYAYQRLTRLLEYSVGSVHAI